MFEFAKKNEKVIIIVIITILVFISISKIISSCSHSVVNNLTSDKWGDVKKLSMNSDKDAEIILRGIAQKDGDWTTYPLSKEFLEKYNSKDGIFPQYTFENVSGNIVSRERLSELPKFSLKNNQNNIKPDGGYAYYIGNGLYKIWQNSTRDINIVYYLNNNNELNDFIITYDKQSSDENGDIIKQYDDEITVDNFRKILTEILFYNKHRVYMMADKPYVKNMPLSKKLLNKILIKKEETGDLFIEFFPNGKYELGTTYVIKGNTWSDAFEKKEFYVCCEHYEDGFDFPIEDYIPSNNYLYKVSFDLNSENLLNDISIEYIGEISNEDLERNYDKKGI